MLRRSAMTKKPGKCKHCRKRLEQLGQRIHEDCVDPWLLANHDANKAKAERKKKRAAALAKKQERAQDRAKRAALKTIPDLIKEAQIEFNAYIRARDKDKPCICCGRKESDVDGLRSHGWDAGHYRSTGSASHLRFNEDNCHRQLVLCNRYGAGRAVDYRLGLIGRIGLDRVVRLETDNTPHKWTREELIGIRDKYRDKTKELKAKQ